MSSSNVAILVDNMYLQNAKDSYGIFGGMDPRKFPIHLLREGETHYKTYIFDALPYAPRGSDPRRIERRARKKSYFDAIQYYERVVVEEGYVKGRHTRCFNCNNEFTVPVQKLVDVKLSVRLVSLAWEKVVDKIVLLCGDSDILPAVEAIEKTGIIVRLAYIEYGNTRTNKALIKACPEKQKLEKADLEALVLE